MNTRVTPDASLFFSQPLAERDPAIFDAVNKELGRQRDEIELIASENIVSRAVMEAQGTVLTNKYAEGYPGKRYYGGCQYVDIVEELAIERAKELFGAGFVNVQPNSGSQMNQAVFLALLQPGDTFMGLDLNSGGHLTHGSPVNMSGKWFNVVSYGVRADDHLLDMDEIEKKAHETKPKLILAGGTAYSRVWDWKRFREIADAVGAYLMVDMAHIAGLIAAGLHQNPVPYADFVTTTTHKTLRGPRGGAILCKEEYAERIDKAIFPGIQGGPLMHVIAAKAVSFGEALEEDFKLYQEQIIKNAKVLADSLMEKGIELVSGGTDNHLILLDVRNRGLTGKKAEALLDEVKVTTNKNTIPFDPESPFVTSGVRMGTPAVTTRGMMEKEMEEIAEIIDLALDEREDRERITQRVLDLCKRFPLYE